MLKIQYFLIMLGNPVINLLILDFEGAEQLILETLPWEKVGNKTNYHEKSSFVFHVESTHPQRQ